MLKKIIGALVATAFVAAGAYLHSPYAAVATMTLAIGNKDPVAFNELVDYDKVRASLVTQMVAQSAGQGLKLSSGVTHKEALEGMLKQKVNEKTLPELLIRAASKGDGFEFASMQWDLKYGISAIDVRLYDPNDGPRNHKEEFTFHLERKSPFSLHWTVVGITLPASL